MKKILCVLMLVFALVCVLGSCKSSDDLPDEPFATSKGLAYEVYEDGKHCGIIGLGTCTDSNIYISNYIDGYKISGIEKNAFSNNTSITSVTIGNSVMWICAQAFYGCTGLTSVAIGSSVEIIDEQVFYGCTGLTRIVVDENNAIYQSINGNLYSKDGTTLVVYAGGKTDTSFAIPNSVTTISKEAFVGCSSLMSVTIPNSVTAIGDSAFLFCTNLTNITIPDSVTTIGEMAFSRCNDLASVTIGNAVTTIGDHAFAGCSNLTSATIGNSVTTIGFGVFMNCNSLTSVTFANPNGWYRTISRDPTGVPTDGTAMSATELSNPTTAAQCLRLISDNNNLLYVWYRK